MTSARRPCDWTQQAVRWASCEAAGVPLAQAWRWLQRHGPHPRVQQSHRSRCRSQITSSSWLAYVYCYEVNAILVAAAPSSLSLLPILPGRGACDSPLSAFNAANTLFDDARSSLRPAIPWPLSCCSSCCCDGYAPGCGAELPAGTG